MSDSFEQAKRIFRRAGGTLRMSEALAQGVHRRALYSMRDAGELQQLSRGLYRLSAAPALQMPDLVTVAMRIPQGVICLVSALAFHELTTQIPHSIDVALPRGTEKPRLDFPPITPHWMSTQAFSSGVEQHLIDNEKIRIYSAEKSVADAFKYRNKIGLDVAIEALKFWRDRRSASMERLLEQARVCRVERVLRPYLEALT